MQKPLHNFLILFVIGAALCFVIAIEAQVIVIPKVPPNQTITVGNQNSAPRQISQQINTSFNNPNNLPLSPASSSFAVAQNFTLRNGLKWNFGGKSQNGWFIYQPLITDLIEVDANADANAFAQGVARWQRRAGLFPNGIVDETTLGAMFKTWQSNRVYTLETATPNQLIQAPISDFYDPTRAADLLYVERETYNAYKKMVRAAVADKSLKLGANTSGELASTESFMKIVSAFRSPEYQAKLRRASPNSGRAGLALKSVHSSGRALDIYVGGEPVTTKDFNRAIQINTPVYRWLVKNAGKFGFKPYFYEPWHWEYAPETNNKIPPATVTESN